MKEEYTFGNDPGQRGQETLKLTSYLLHKHYCENDEEALIALFDREIYWIGAGEQEYAVGREKVSGIFRQFSGQVLKCNITDEHYDVMEVAPEVYLCTGRAWIATDPQGNAYLRVHQRITTIFRGIQGRPYCCHIHISNPYMEMAEHDVGFPTKMARHSFEYAQKRIEQQRKQIERQTAELISIYNTVPCAIMRVRRTKEGYELVTFNQGLANMLEMTEEQVRGMNWSEGVCEEVVEEDVPKIKRLMKSLENPGDDVTINYRLKKSSGEMIYLTSNNALIAKDDDGELIQRIAFDVTERPKLEELLEKKSNEDALTGLFNRNKFSQVMKQYRYAGGKKLGLAYFDVNGLKVVNDTQGHSAGDEMLCRAAKHINCFFEGKGYRIGGDEFVVIDDELDRDAFDSAVSLVCKKMEDDGINIAVGCSWRDSDCNIELQFEEADHRMYQDKKQFYSQKKNDRRRR